MSWTSLDRTLFEFGERVDSIRGSLLFADGIVLSRQLSRPSMLTELRATSYVLASAYLERYVRGTIDAVLREIENSGINLLDLRPSLFALACATELEALRDLRKLKMWEARVNVFDLFESQSRVSFEAGVRPVDGRTLRAEHFLSIWKVFGFRSPSLPHGVHTGVLLDLANNRNDIAHGDETPEAIGRRKTTPDVLKMLDRLEEIALHLHMRAAEYLDSGAFRR